MPLSSCQQGKSHPQVMLSTFWSTMRAAVFRGPKGEGDSKDMGLFTCRSQRPSLVPRKGEFCLNYFTYMHQTRLYALPPGKVWFGSSLSSLLKILSLAYTKSPDLNLLVILTERTINLLCLISTFHVFKEKYQVSPQPFPSLPASPPVSPTFPLRPYISGH